MSKELNANFWNLLVSIKKVSSNFEGNALVLSRLCRNFPLLSYETNNNLSICLKGMALSLKEALSHRTGVATVIIDVFWR
jgi:hypothetical protein